MTQASSGNGQQNNGNGARPIYSRFAFWLILGMLIGLVLMLVLMRSCQRPPEVASTAPDSGAELAGLLDVQRAHNSGLEAELRRLQGLLKEDPCSLAGFLGASPQETPVAPSYRQPETPPPGGRDAAPPAGNATAPLTGNATAKIPPAPIASSAPPPATVAELMDRATVFVMSAHGEDVGMGSGFFVAPGIIATNRHVAQGPEAQVIVGNKALGGMQAARILAFSPSEDRDYALLAVSPELAAKAPVLQIAEGAGRTERVSAWGFPGYITAIDPNLKAMVEGNIKSVPEVVYSEGVVSVVLDRQPQVILHTASLSQGNSGGPLINAQGVVVGINTFIRQADQSYSQTNIALPGADLAAFMRENGVNASAPAKQGE